MLTIRKFYKRYSLFVLILAVMGFYSCSSFKTDSAELNEQSLNRLRIAVLSDSTDLESLKEYSIMLVKAKEHALAKKYLNKAIIKMPNDPALLFNQGLNYEFLNENYNALQAYSKYPLVPTSLYNELMKGRFLLLSREVADTEIKELIRNEASIETSKISSKNLAVFPLTYLGSDEKYAPLSTGFSEMISIDLGKVKELTVLERIRLQAVLDELEFGKSDQVDKSTAPRLGKLLSAGKVYNGAFNVNENRELFLEISSLDIIENQSGSIINKEVDLSDLFVIEKEIVFDIIDQLGIELSPVEREEIEYIPTQNINAFLAYSKGLELENAGNFGQAVSFFQRATELDPNFKDASNKTNSNKSLNTSNVSKEGLSELTNSLEKKPDVLITDTANLINQRMDVLGRDIRINFTQSIDSRKPAQDVSVANISGIPFPPPRPSKP